MDTFIYYLELLEVNLPIYINSIPEDEIKYIYFNAEQLSRASQLERVLSLINTRKPVEVWDYSSANTSILSKHGVDCTRHVAVQSPTWYVLKLRNLIPPQNTYDVGFCGELSDRRLFILNELRQCGLNVGVTQTWGIERDAFLASCTLLINIHYADDYNIFEAARCEPWFSLKPIISECSLDDDSRCINVEYGVLVATVRDWFQLNSRVSNARP
jgi:hypothetical protein